MRISLLMGAALLSAAFFWQSFVPYQNPRAKLNYSFNEGFISLNADTVELVSVGYERLLSSLIWLRFLQNTPVQKIEPGKTSWIFHDLLSISTLDPNFYPIYTDAAIFLSVITEDKQGAEEIFLRGTRQFPGDWRIHSYLGYHYEWEMRDSSRAYEHYRMAANDSNAPDLLRVLAASYTINSNISKTAAQRLIRNYMEKVKNPAMLERLKEKLKFLESKR